MKACVGDKLNIFSNTELKNKKFGSNIDVHMKDLFPF